MTSMVSIALLILASAFIGLAIWNLRQDKKHQYTRAEYCVFAVLSFTAAFVLVAASITVEFLT